MSKSPPPITILVPTIGRMDYLPETRRSVSAQTRGDFEVLVLDNASPADARDFFADWARADSRVKIMRADPRVPMFSNFNRGMRATKTELVTFFHDDDVYTPRFLEVLAGELERHPTAAFAGSNFDFVGHDGELLEERRWIKTTELWDAPRYVAQLVGRGRNPVPMPGLVFRRAAFGPDGFDETLPIYYGDFVLLMRASESGGMVASSETVVKIRRHPGQASMMTLSQGIVMRTALLAKYVDEYAARHPEDAALVAQLKGRIELTHRAAMVWGWTVADDERERRACVDALGEGRVDGVLRKVLGWADEHGLRPRRTARLVKAARTAANVLRI